MTKLTVICESWTPRRKNTLLGFASINIGELELKVHDVAVHQKGDRTWAALPARPWVQNGAVATGDDGKVQYSIILEFSRREVRDAFSNAVVRAVIERFPGRAGGGLMGRRSTFRRIPQDAYSTPAEAVAPLLMRRAA